MTLHVLQLGPYPPPEGGISRNMLAIRDALIDRGDRCSIIATSKTTASPTDPDVHFPRSAAALLGLLRRLSFDVIHLHVGGRISPRVLALAFTCTVFGRGRTVISVHSGGLAARDSSASPLSPLGFVLRRFSAVIAVSSKLAKLFEQIGVSPAKLSVIAPYVLSKPDAGVQLRDDLREFCSRHTPLLIAVGGLEKDYEPLFQVEAVDALCERFPNIGLMIVGGGSMEREVVNAAARTKCPDAICVAGDVPHDQTLHLIAAADVLLRTTLFDGDAISVREGLFLGTPVIATDNGMRPDGVHLIVRGDRQGLVDAVERAVTSGRGPSLEDEGHDNIRAVLSIYDRLMN